MKLYDPTKVYFEEQCVVKHIREVPGERVLVMTGKKSSKANHALADVAAGLGQSVEIAGFDEVEPNPSIAMVEEVARRYRGFRPEICVGVGGGSALDAAKAVAVLLANDEAADVETLFYVERNAASLPVIAVPTTCGTGSEVTPFSVLTDTEKNTKRTIFSQLYPQLALIDPAYLQTIPYGECVSTCVDALAHLTEGFLSSRANAYNRFYSETGLRLFGECKDCLTSRDAFEVIDAGTREKLMACAMFGGYAIATNGSSIPHGLANTITHELNISHGRTVILFIPGYLRNYQDQQAVAKLLQFLDFASVDALEEYLFSVLGCVRIPKALWNSEVDKMLANKHKLSSYPFEMTKDILQKYPGRLFCV